MALVRCPKCERIIPSQRFNQQPLEHCHRCEAMLAVEAFPALLRATASQAGRTRQSDEESSCFFHPGKVAAVACDACGRFLCALCDVSWGSQHLCPGCYEDRCHNQPNVKSDYVHIDNVAILLALVPTLVSGLIAIYLVIRYWNRPLSALPRTRVRHVIALLLALLQVGYLGHRWFT